MFDEMMENGALMSMGDLSVLIGYGPCTLKHSVEDLDPNIPAFYFPDFFGSHTHTWHQYKNWRKMKIDALAALIPDHIALPELEWQLTPQEQFSETFDQLQKLLHKGILRKGVPYIFAHSSTTM